MSMLFKFQLPVRPSKIDRLLHCTACLFSLIPVILNSLHQLLAPALSLCSGPCPTSHVHTSPVPLSFFFMIFGSQHVFLGFSRVQHPQISNSLFSLHETLMFFRGMLCRLGCHLTPFFFFFHAFRFFFPYRESWCFTLRRSVFYLSSARRMETNDLLPGVFTVAVLLKLTATLLLSPLGWYCAAFYVKLITHPGRFDCKKSKLICCGGKKEIHTSLWTEHFAKWWLYTLCRYNADNNRLVCVATELLWSETFMWTRMQTKEGDCCRSGMKLEKKNPIKRQ